MSIRSYPFLTLDRAFLVARLATAVFFMAHAIVRIVSGSIPQFGQFMETSGFPAGVAVVWAITVTELIAGTLLVVNRYVRAASVALGAIVVGGIGLIHVRLGWFVGEHGTGGSEYSVALLTLLLLVAAYDRQQTSAA